MLVQLTYWSRTGSALTDKDIEMLQTLVDQNNKTHSITGCLIRLDDYFLQVIEGDDKAVNRLYNNIVRDPRHTDITLVTYMQITRRKYADWMMIVDAEQAKNLPLMLSYAGTAAPFSFDGMSAATIDMMLNEFYRAAAKR